MPNYTGPIVAGVDSDGHPHNLLTDGTGTVQANTGTPLGSQDEGTFIGEIVAGVDSDGHPHNLLTDEEGRLYVNVSGGGGSTDIFTLNFTYQTLSPSVLQAVVAGHVLIRASIVITTPFDGVGANLLLGTTANPSMVLGAADSVPSVADQYESTSIFQFQVSDILQFVINPNGSTQGAGLLLYEYD
jgi:hypothetical protein